MDDGTDDGMDGWMKRIISSRRPSLYVIAALKVIFWTKAMLVSK
jgi:hypothetical protein